VQGFTPAARRAGDYRSAGLDCGARRHEDAWM